jgi:selenocysteine lyase/cysteine desulfurase
MHDRRLTAEGLQAFKEYHQTIRSSFPFLECDGDGNPRVYLDSGAGTLVPRASIEAMSRAYAEWRAQPGEISPSECHTRDQIWRTRELLARFLNAPSPDEITFHLSTTHSLLNLAIAFHPMVQKHHNIIVTDADHFANISPWEVIFGERGGVEIRRLRATDRGQVDLDHLRSLVDQNTRIVAMTYAANAVGTVMPIAQIADMVHSFRDDSGNGAYLVVDAVHHACHGPIDVQQSGCDFLTISGYKLFGPVLGVLWTKREHMERLDPYCVPPNPDSFEQGTQNNAVLGAMQGALRYLLTLGNHLAPFCRDDLQEYRDAETRLFKIAMTTIAQYERELTREVLRQFEAFPKGKFRHYGLRTVQDGVWTRHPTFCFEVLGKTGTEVKQLCWQLGRIEVAKGDIFSAMVNRHLDREEVVTRASFAHYDDLRTVHALTSTLDSILAL